jgi:DNA (cytosine-5)-methyltransferase 1
MNGKPIIISLFSGCGGSSLGYKLAGFNELLAIDFNKNSIDTFKLNFPNISCWQKDITKVSSNEILDFCKIKKGELDLLDASPPCQGFSVSGKRQINDNRNELFLEFIKLIKELEPKVFLMENVSGLIKGKMKGIFNIIMKEFNQLNYNTKCSLMNSMYYNVPQNRERLIWIGYRKDFNKIPTFPIPNKNIIIVKEALQNCPDGIYYKPSENTLINQYIKKIRQGETGAKYHYKGNFFNIKRLRNNLPSYTLPKKAGRNIIHPIENRFITDREAARLSSFPDNFKFIGSAIERISRIGNAVMPKFMEAIALNIKKEMF